MELIEAIRARHSVREYANRPIEHEKIATLRIAVEKANAASGLNTCWVGLTYRKVPGAFTLGDGETVHCVISLGYGISQGRQHPLRPIEKFYEAGEEVPEWFKAGLEAALLAPTAVNQQKFRFILHEGDRVEAKALFSIIGYTYVDLGIAKYHFEIGAGMEHFNWI